MSTLHTIGTTFTRPADTNAYAAGDVVCNSTSAPVIMTFPGAARRGARGGFGILQDATLFSSANVATKLDCELLLFDTTVAMDNDNAAFTPTDAELLTLVARVPFYASAWSAGDATAGAGGNAFCQVSNLGIPFNVGAVNDLFGVLVARAAYTPVSAEVFTVRLKVLD